MSQVECRWRQINRENQKLNELIGKPKDLPHQFGPSRFRSQSADRNFRIDRSRIYSNSIERSTLNLTRQDDSVQKGRFISPKKQKMKDPENEVSRLKRQIQELQSLGLTQRQSSIRKDDASKIQSSQMVIDLKKQFLAFKQNVLQQLERQKTLVNQLIREVMQTVEVELQRLGKISTIDELTSIKMFNPTITESQKIEANNFEQLMSNLEKSKVKKSKITHGRSTIENKPPPKSESISINEKQTIVDPPKGLIDFSMYTNGIQQLKKQIQDMGVLIDGINSEGSAKKMA